MRTRPSRRPGWRWATADVDATIFLLAAAGVVASLSDYRLGLVIVVIGGLLQDPVRKVMEGQSPYWMGLVFVFFAATFAGALASAPHSWWRRPDWRQLRRATELFLAVLVLQAFVTMFRTGSLLLIGIGAAAYLGPMVAVVLGSWAGTKRRVVVRFLVAYVLSVAAMASGIVLWQLGYRWTALKTIGVDLVVYDWQLGAIVLPSGFFRGPEVASWHCATAACAAVILAASGRASRARWIALGGLVTFLFWAVLVAGRRKGIAEAVIFVAFFGVLQVWVRGRLGRFGGAILVAVVLGAFVFQRYGLTESVEGQLGSMSERSGVGGGPFGRVLGSFTSIPNVVQAAGMFGTGLGTGTQGAQHFRATEEAWGIISESGLARLVAELGVPGSAVALLLVFRLLKGLRRRLPNLRGSGAEDPSLTLGLMALVGANAVVFVSAHQIFGDPLVYIFLGISVGFVIAGLDVADDREATDAVEVGEAAVA